MRYPVYLPLWAEQPLVPWLLGAGAILLAAASALPYAGGWNDGSRLATVESIADHHTLKIDDSIFCRPPPDTLARGCPPYPAGEHDLLVFGTRDKLLIGGHFYSDKPVLISLLMAGIYQGCQWLGMPAAAARPDLFCRALTVGTSGLAYLVAVLALYRLGLLVRLPPRINLAWTASFALADFALTYTQHVNNHILLLAVVALVCLQFAHLAQENEAGRVSWWRVAGLGTLAGLGFNLDLGSGPLLAAGMLGLLLYRCRSKTAGLIFVLAALPWVAGWLAINHAIGGVWKPMNMVPEYSAWPGCPFNPQNMTGYSRHSPGKLLVYALALLFGKQGFICHNLALFLVFPAMGVMWRRSTPNRPELTFALGWCAATWLLYAVLSNNYGGACCSVRWFVPFLAPGYYLLAIYLRKYPQYFPDFLGLSIWGGVLALFMWRQGPWTQHVIAVLWPLVGAALLTWAVCPWRCRRAMQSADSLPLEPYRRLAA
jgi:hypothetical protein